MAHYPLDWVEEGERVLRGNRGTELKIMEGNYGRGSYYMLYIFDRIFYIRSYFLHTPNPGGDHGMMMMMDSFDITWFSTIFYERWSKTPVEFFSSTEDRNWWWRMRRSLACRRYNVSVTNEFLMRVLNELMSSSLTSMVVVCEYGSRVWIIWFTADIRTILYRGILYKED